MKQFDSIADQYDNVLPAHVSGHYFQKRIRVLSGLISSGAVLDLCAGTGRISEGMIRKGYRVVSLDLSLPMLQVRRNVEGYNPVNADSTQLPFKSQTFDMAVSIAAFHHLSKPENVRATIIEMQRVTKACGYIVIWDHNPLNPYWKFLMKKVPQDSGEERLIPVSELTSPFSADEYDLKVCRLGFIPDFVPKGFLKIFTVIEKIVESIPALNRFTAHNVVIARKRRERVCVE